MELDVILVIALCALFTLAAMGGVTTAAFLWSAYQKSQVDDDVKRIKDEAERMYQSLRQDYERLKHDYESLNLKYQALAEVVMGKTPEVSISAQGDVTMGEFTGHDKQQRGMR